MEGCAVANYAKTYYPSQLIRIVSAIHEHSWSATIALAGILFSYANGL